MTILLMLVIYRQEGVKEELRTCPHQRVISYSVVILETILPAPFCDCNYWPVALRAIRCCLIASVMLHSAIAIKMKLNRMQLRGR